MVALLSCLSLRTISLLVPNDHVLAFLGILRYHEFDAAPCFN